MRKANKPKASFESYESKSVNSNYIRITHSMMNSSAWQELNCYEKVLYMELKKKHKGPATARNLSFTYKEGENLMAKRTFTKSIDKLIEVGLIDLERHKPYSVSCNIYALSDRWHKYGSSEFKEKYRPKIRSKTSQDLNSTHLKNE